MPACSRLPLPACLAPAPSMLLLPRHLCQLLGVGGTHTRHGHCSATGASFYPLQRGMALNLLTGVAALSAWRHPFWRRRGRRMPVCLTSPTIQCRDSLRLAQNRTRLRNHGSGIFPSHQEEYYLHTTRWLRPPRWHFGAVIDSVAASSCTGSSGVTYVSGAVTVVWRRRDASAIVVPVTVRLAFYSTARLLRRRGLHYRLLTDISTVELR